jgi:pyridoxal phosphate enzyme (YggS family)
MTRAAELAAGVAAVRGRIAAACASSGRDLADVHLVVVTKTWPASDVRLLSALGLRDVGENRDQEARAKAAQTTDLDLVWHFVGQLQANKAGSVASYASVVHSVDRPRLVQALSRGAQDAGRTIGALVQVSLDTPGSGGAASPGPDHRGGAGPDLVRALADAVARSPGLELRGVMAVAPVDADPAEAFERLAAVAAGLRADHPAADWISAGMSADLEAAVAAGATHVRVGSAILGRRPALR